MLLLFEIDGDLKMTVPHPSARKINYLRLSITERCNLRCRYCMPSTAPPARDAEDRLSYAELLHIVDAAVALGVRKVRVTGGEPLVREGALDFIRQVAQVPRIEEVALTTNGVLLDRYADALKEAGIRTLNISLDSLDQKIFREMTRTGNLATVLRGIKSADDVGLKIKLNMVVMRGVNDHEVLRFAELGLTRPWAIRFIEYMPTIRKKSWRSQLVSGTEVLDIIQQKYSLEPLTGTRYCGPARQYRIAGAVGTIGIISPMSDHFCGSCNRIRVTADGLAKSCLLNAQATDLKPYLSQPVGELTEILSQVIANKPERHRFLEDDASFNMSSIGG